MLVQSQLAGRKPGLLQHSSSSCAHKQLSAKHKHKDRSIPKSSSPIAISINSSASSAGSSHATSSAKQMDYLDSTPNAVASSSRHTLPSKVSTRDSSFPARRIPRQLRRRLLNASVYLVSAFLLPLLSSANPLPQSMLGLAERRHRSHPYESPRQIGIDLTSTIHHIASSAEDLLMFHLHRRDNTSTSPIIEMAHYNSALQAYRLPDGYVELRQHFHAGFIVLSYAIAFVGSLCTLELLIRRTTNTGWRNQLLLASAGICFGAVSTFAMHFVFNNALSLHHPMMDQKSYPALYLSYDPGFTILSLVVSCLAMTTAFFVMGTQIRDWLAWPGFRSKDKLGRRDSPSRVEADDYGKWKKSHKKVLRRGTMGAGALFAQASNVAKWSMMDGEGSGGMADNGRYKLGGYSGGGKSSNWKEEVQGMYSPVTRESERMFEDDEALQELNFRLGKDAVRQELERRAGATTPTSTRASQNGSLHHSASSHPMLTPLPIIYAPSSRRSSVGSALPLPSPDVFAASFNFPPRIEPDHTSSANPNLISPSTGLPNGRTPSPTFGEPTMSYQPERRRASLPANVLTTHRDRPSYSGPSTTLARIQSLPEGDLEPSSSGSISSNEEKNIHKTIPPATITARLSSYSGKTEGRSERSQKRVRLKASSTTWTRLGMFLGFDVVTSTEIMKIVITGTIAGFGVVGMHYIGQASITGLPYIAYHPAYVIGSIIIACGAVIIALYIMFIMLRPKLKHTWLSKICVAFILAIAVTCMHFCGMMGTTYAWPAGKGISRHNKLTGTNVIITGIVAALAFSACIACAVFFLLHSLNLRRERARRRRVVIAAVLLDERDRVLVNSIDGMLPMCDIASLTGGGDVPSPKKSFIQSVSSDSTVLGMDLTTGHDAFVSALKLSWTWKNPSLVPLQSASSTDGRSQGNDSILQATFSDIRRGSLLTTNTTTGTMGSRPPVSLTKFLERFTISSCQLAVRLLGQTDGISRLGVLYDQILTTGWVKLNNSNDTVSKGQLIFLVRRVASAAERLDLESRHFIFADSQSVAQALHKTLSVPLDHTIPLLDDMRTFCDSTLQSRLQPGKLYAGVAVVQATPFDGLRILLEQNMRSQLPLREVCDLGVPSHDENELGGTVEEIGEALALLEGMSILSIMTRNMTNDQGNQLLSKRVTALLRSLERAIAPMLDEMLTSEDMTHILPRLTLHPMLIPLTPGGSKRTISSYIPPYAIIFYANYDAAVNTFTDKWLPFSLFRAQNACVMAPKIAAAAKMDQLYTAETDNAGISTSTSTIGRRPSRVQFDFNQTSQLQQHSHQMQQDMHSPATSSRDVDPIQKDDEDADVVGGMFSNFTFPPRSSEEKERERDPKSISSVLQNGHRMGSISHSGAGVGVGVGRKSSLARSRFNSTGGESTSPSGHGSYAYEHPQMDFKCASTGVAIWEPDWLLHLLKIKLRADA
ncbi:uncharacterized protein I303_102583 [Kwoniella dejecticola CBS 10117]|uniref:MHYT domain-containing protein n=1 Tax=Kwoniella dejecticola CBS 10117 TaxID=1296121 RepID=A0A1A6A958_9TREE|nr:uncharacterized protein I303_02597 [Kwoniella dejecticola CBS 10117]OBR86589.1 hypothetical protein I303_02597 [Kwoniella dejecticola CBS 10117]